MELFYYGHSTLQINTNQTSIIIDPLISRNPCANYNVEDVKVDYILLTHGHHDHFGDTYEIARMNDALVIAPYEMGIYLRAKGLKTHPMNISGSREFDFGRVKLTYARHSSSCIW
jgi:L-ascorbate metabolism protein UlaG (beta-lactamase superfamily)